jgi:hypothetical protein
MGKVITVKKIDKRKHNRAGWATPEQETWLRELIPKYVASKSPNKKNLGDFWGELWEGWFKNWPEPEPVMLPVADGST